MIVIDQLPGHWAKEVKVLDNMPPVNVWDYARLGFAKNFRFLIENGIFCFAWNKGECDTPHGMKYLATGRYNAAPYWASVNGWPYYPRTPDRPGPIGLFEYAQHHAPNRIKSASFTTDHWLVPGYFFTHGYGLALSGYFPDELMWRNFVMPFLRKRRN